MFNKEAKQKFNATVSIQFYEVDQELKLFTPKQNIPIQPLPRNILYPFKVYKK
jgi:hypothetical protein